MLEANKFKLGVFVASGILLIILSFFIHGPPVCCVTYMRLFSALLVSKGESREGQVGSRK